MKERIRGWWERRKGGKNYIEKPDEPSFVQSDIQSHELQQHVGAAVVFKEPEAAPAGQTQEVEKEPYDRYIVIADDVPRIADFVGGQVEHVFSENTEKRQKAKVARGMIDLLESALVPEENGGKQADAVLLDDSYGNDTYDWRHKPQELEAFANRLGIDFSQYLPPECGNSYIVSTNIPDTRFLFFHTDATTNALLLRILGYTGKIFIVSSAPPTAQEIMSRVRDLRAAVPGTSIPDAMPVNGFSAKEPRRFDGVINYSDEVQSDNKWVDKEISGGYLKDTLRILLG